jgi:hypothetical protein
MCTPYLLPLREEDSDLHWAYDVSTSMALQVLWYSVICWQAVVIIPEIFRRHAACEYVGVYKYLAMLSLGMLLGIPRLERVRAIPPVAAAMASAGVIQFSRTFSILHPRAYIEYQELLRKKDVVVPRFHEWPLTRTVLYYCAFGWHDFRKVSALTNVEVRATLTKELYDALFRAVGGLAVGAVAVFLLGRPDARHFTDFTNEAFASQFCTGCLHVYLRAVLAGITMRQGFLCFDLFSRMAYTSLGLLVDPIFGTIELRENNDKSPPFLATFKRFFFHVTSNCSTVRQFWGQHWNIPVHVMLVEGVYIPMKRRGWSTSAASFSVFVVSGLGHVYSLNALACPMWTQLCMMVFFVVQPILIHIEKLFVIRHPAFVFGSLSLLLCFFVEPLLFVVGYGFTNL